MLQEPVVVRGEAASLNLQELTWRNQLKWKVLQPRQQGWNFALLPQVERLPHWLCCSTKKKQNYKSLLGPSLLFARYSVNVPLPFISAKSNTSINLNTRSVLQSGQNTHAHT